MAFHLPGGEAPDKRQIGDIRLRDLRERAVPPTIIGAAKKKPIAVFRIAQPLRRHGRVVLQNLRHRSRHRHIRGRRNCLLSRCRTNSDGEAERGRAHALQQPGRLEHDFLPFLILETGLVCLPCGAYRINLYLGLRGIEWVILVKNAQGCSKRGCKMELHQAAHAVELARRQNWPRDETPSSPIESTSSGEPQGWIVRAFFLICFTVVLIFSSVTDPQSQEANPKGSASPALPQLSKLPDLSKLTPFERTERIVSLACREKIINDMVGSAVSVSNGFVESGTRFKKYENRNAALYFHDAWKKQLPPPRNDWLVRKVKIKRINHFPAIAFLTKQSRTAVRWYVFGEGSTAGLERETKTYDLVVGETALVQFNYLNDELETIEVDCKGIE